MSDEIRRRKTSDPEMDAIVLISQALASLDTETCARVLKWAEDRYIEQAKREIKELAWTGGKGQIEAYQKYAERMGVKDTTLAHAIAHVRSVERLAPIDHDEHPDKTEAAALERAKA